LAGTPTVTDIAQFNNSVLQGSPSVDPTRGVHGISHAPIKQFGDRIISEAQDFRTTYCKTFDQVQQVMANGMKNVGTTQLLQIQLAVMKLGIAADLTAKMADKSSQSLQTLFRNQG
jgi:type III secretion system YscI/HrpB-like protein